MIEEEHDYRVIVLPFGLIQVFRDIDRLNPSNDEFDFVRTIEYAAAPLHYTIGRDRSDSKADDFIVGHHQRRAEPRPQRLQGLHPGESAARGGPGRARNGERPSEWCRVGGSFQGIYVGAGAYGSLQTASTIDERLTEILRADERIYFPLTQLTAQNSTQGQAALAIAGGYRAALRFRLAWGLAPSAKVSISLPTTTTSMASATTTSTPGCGWTPTVPAC